VRTQAVLMIAMMKDLPPPRFSWGWDKAPLNRHPLFSLGYAVTEADVKGIAAMLEHPDAAVRRASAEALGLYTLPPYAGVAKSAVPLLMQASKDADLDVRLAVGDTLKKIDSQAATKAGIK
jgi:HEAT repeat protein